MPLLGWLLGRQFADSISALDHWVAFVLLGYIGGKMIYDAIKERMRRWRSSRWTRRWR